MSAASGVRVMQPMGPDLRAPALLLVPSRPMLSACRNYLPENIVIHFIPNDPLAAAQNEVRQVVPRPDRKPDEAGFSVGGNEPEDLYSVGTSGFVRWQARQAAILAVEAWEAATDTSVDSWAAEVPHPRTLPVLPDAGVDLNAFYDRTSLSFFHRKLPGKTVFTGGHTDVVSHETGHAMLDALRPDLWDANLLEVGAAHEAVGDIVAHITALSDPDTRRVLLAPPFDVGTPNFVEATAEELSDAVRIAIGPQHPASNPRRALNAFQWQLPETMPVHGGPDDMIAEVHSMARILTGCFYDLLRNVFANRDEAALWDATRLCARLLHKALANALEVPRFFRSIGRQLVLADAAQNGGAHRGAIEQAFAGHSIALGAAALLAPELTLRGKAPEVTPRAAAVADATISDLRRHLDVGDAPAAVSPVDLSDTTVAKVSFTVDVPLDEVDDRLRGVVCPVRVPALVGESGGAAALLSAPRPDASTEETQQFVRVLIAHDQVGFDTPSPSAPQRTHQVQTYEGKRELRRVAFACCPR